MSAPIFHLTGSCFGAFPAPAPKGEKSNSGTYVLLACTAVDTLVSLTALVFAILALTSTLALPTAVMYTLFGLSAGITILWLIAITKDCCR